MFIHTTKVESHPKKKKLLQKWSGGMSPVVKLHPAQLRVKWFLPLSPWASLALSPCLSYRKERARERKRDRICIYREIAESERRRTEEESWIVRVRWRKSEEGVSKQKSEPAMLPTTSKSRPSSSSSSSSSSRPNPMLLPYLRRIIKVPISLLFLLQFYILSFTTFYLYVSQIQFTIFIVNAIQIFYCNTPNKFREEK